MSWATAFNDLQVGIDAATPNNFPDLDQIWVKAGTYKPTSQADSFQLEAGVEVYGGFAGVETMLSERNPDPATNNTLLSGDLGVPGDFSDNAFIVVKGKPLDSDARLDGFTVKGATNAAIENINNSPTLEYLLIMNNTSAGNGAGMRNLVASRPIVTISS